VGKHIRYQFSESNYF